MREAQLYVKRQLGSGTYIEEKLRLIQKRELTNKNLQVQPSCNGEQRKICIAVDKEKPELTFWSVPAFAIVPSHHLQLAAIFRLRQLPMTEICAQILRGSDSAIPRVGGERAALLSRL